jgi:hypothetical protein
MTAAAIVRDNSQKDESEEKRDRICSCPMCFNTVCDRPGEGLQLRLELGNVVTGEVWGHRVLLRSLWNEI